MGFRYSALATAQRLGLTGWVRNRSDGTVEGLAAGDAAALADFRAWLQRGPPAGKVDQVEWTATDELVPLTFEVRR